MKRELLEQVVAIDVGRGQLTRVWFRLALAADDEHLCTWRSQATIARDLLMTQPSVKSALARLAAKGLIRRWVIIAGNGQTQGVLIRLVGLAEDVGWEPTPDDFPLMKRRPRAFRAIDLPVEGGTHSGAPPGGSRSGAGGVLTAAPGGYSQRRPPGVLTAAPPGGTHSGAPQEEESVEVSVEESVEKSCESARANSESRQREDPEGDVVKGSQPPALTEIAEVAAALSKIVCPRPNGKGGQREWDEACASLRADGANLGRIRTAAERYRADMPRASLTPRGLAKHYTRLMSPAWAAPAASSRIGDVQEAVNRQRAAIDGTDPRELLIGRRQLLEQEREEEYERERHLRLTEQALSRIEADAAYSIEDVREEFGDGVASNVEAELQRRGPVRRGVSHPNPDPEEVTP